MTKEEQLYIVFKELLLEMIEETDDFLCPDYPDLVSDFASRLLTEVKIRTKI